MTKLTVVVVGSGIAGMTAAFRLHQAGFSVRVLEAEDIVGGRMSCHRIKGFTFNRAATSLAGKYDFLKDLIEEVGLGAKLEYRDFKIATYRDGRLYPLRTNHMMRDSFFSGLLSWRSKFLMTRVLDDVKRNFKYLSFTDLSVSAPIDTETVEAYAKRRLNQELLDYVIDPCMAAVLATTPAKPSVVDFLFSLAHYNGTGAYSFDGGIDFLTEELARRVPVETGARVQLVQENSDGAEVTWQKDGVQQVARCSACVIAVSANQVPALYPQLKASQREILNGYEYSKIIACHFGVDVELNEIDAEYVQIPQREIPGMIITMFPHKMSRGSVAPPGKGIVACYSIDEWSNAHIGKSDEQIVDAMLPMVERIVPDIRKHIEVSLVTRWAPALFNSKVGSYQAMAEFKKQEDPAARVQLAGDYFSFSSTNASAISGDVAARRIISLHTTT